MGKQSAATVSGAEKRMRDFTTGSIWQHILAFSWPMFVGNLLQALYNTVDSFWVGRFIGADALGAVSISFPIIFGLVALIMGLTMATTTMVSQYRGAGDNDKVRATVANSLLLILSMGLLSSIAGIVFRVDILNLMRTPPEIMEHAAQYLGIFFFGLVPMFSYNVLSSILRGLGDSRTPLRFLAYAAILNMILDPIFIIGWGPIPALGIRGVAWATVIAQTLSAGLAIRYILRHTTLININLREWRLRWDLVKSLFTIGIPAALQSSIVSFSMIIVTSLVNTFGPTVVAAFGAAQRLDQFAFLPAMSIGLAVSALVGQNLGAGKRERVKEIVKWSTVLTISMTGLITLVALLNPTILIKVFTGEENVLVEGARYLRIVSLNYIPLGLMFIITGVLRGAGDTFASMLISFCTLWLVRLPVAWFLSTKLELGVSGVWWSIVISTTLGLLLNYLYYRTGNWLRKVMVRPSMSPA